MRSILLAAIAILFLASCKSIERAVKIDAGAGKSTMNGEKSYKDPVGFQVNIEAKFVEINQRSSFSAGLGFSKQGAKYDEGNGGTGELKVSYLNIPLLYNYLSKGGFYAEAGLQPGFLLSAKDNYNGQDHDYKDFMKKFELGIPVGVGYRFKNGFGIGTRIIQGITNNQDDKSKNLLILALFSYIIKTHE